MSVIEEIYEHAYRVYEKEMPCKARVAALDQGTKDRIKMFTEGLSENQRQAFALIRNEAQEKEELVKYDAFFNGVMFGVNFSFEALCRE